MGSRTVRRALRSLASAVIIVVVLAIGAVSASAEKPGEGVKDVDFTCTSVHVVTNGQDISHVELEFADGTAQRFEDENFGIEEVFTGIGEHDGDIITGAWVKVGNNTSDDAAPGMGEHFTSDAEGCDDDRDEGDDGTDGEDDGDDGADGEDDGDDGTDGQDDGDDGVDVASEEEPAEVDDSTTTSGQPADGAGDDGAEDDGAEDDGADGADESAPDASGSDGAQDAAAPETSEGESEVLDTAEQPAAEGEIGPAGDTAPVAASAEGHSGELPATGLSSLQLLLLALVVTGLGSGLVMAARRRRQRA